MPRSHQSSLQTKNKSRGSITPLVIVWVAVTFAGALAISHATLAVHYRAVAQSTADAVALAVASHGQSRARQFAYSQNAHVLSLTRHNNTITVEVSIHQQRARASVLSPL